MAITQPTSRQPATNGEHANNQLVTQEQLVELTGYRRPADIRRCLERQGIRVHNGRAGRVWATLADIGGMKTGQQTTVKFE